MFFNFSSTHCGEDRTERIHSRVDGELRDSRGARVKPDEITISSVL